ncbi:hypothetical protein ACFLUC_01275 [Chloroflexota bacterium]
MFKKRSEVDVVYIVNFLLSTFSLLFVVITTLGRAKLGIETARAFRYSTLIIPAVLAIYFQILKLPRIRLQKVLVVLFLLLLFVRTIPVTTHSIQLARGFRDAKLAWLEAYAETRNLKEAQTISGFQIYPDMVSISDRVKYLEENNLNFFNDEAFKSTP